MYFYINNDLIIDIILGYVTMVIVLEPQKTKFLKHDSQNFHVGYAIEIQRNLSQMCCEIYEILGATYSVFIWDKK